MPIKTSGLKTDDEGSRWQRIIKYMEFLKDAPGIILDLLVTYHFVLLLTLVFLEEAGLPLPISGDILLLITGYYVFHKQVDLVAAIVAVELGSLAGGSFLYVVGRKGGHTVMMRYGKYISLNSARVEQMERWFQSHSGLAIIVGRMIPGLRPVTSFVAGTFEVRYQPFFLYTAVGTLIWATPFLLIGYFAGREFNLIIEMLYHISQIGPALLFGIFVLAVVVVGAYYIFYLPHKRNYQMKSQLEQSKEIDRGNRHTDISNDKAPGETAIKELDR